MRGVRFMFAGLCIALTMVVPAQALPNSRYVPEFICAVPYVEPGGSCSVELEGGRYELDVWLPHGLEAGVRVDVRTPDGSYFEQDCLSVEGISYGHFSCSSGWAGPSIRHFRSGASGGLYPMEQWADLELFTGGIATITVDEGEGFATLRGRRI